MIGAKLVRITGLIINNNNNNNGLYINYYISYVTSCKLHSNNHILMWIRSS